MGTPSAVVFLNDNVNQNIVDHFTRQLYITITLSSEQFDDIVNVDPDYFGRAKSLGERILVLRDYENLTNREFADVVLYFANGSVAIEKNKFGPPGLNIRAAEVFWTKIGIFEPTLVNEGKCKSCCGLNQCCSSCNKKCNNCSNCNCKCQRCGNRSYDCKCVIDATRASELIPKRCKPCPDPKGIQPYNIAVNPVKKIP